MHHWWIIGPVFALAWLGASLAGGLALGRFLGMVERAYRRRGL